MSEWKEYRISELGKIGRGRSRHRPRNDKVLYGGEYPFIQTGDVKRANFFITEHTATYNEVGLAQSKMWNEDTLCITIAANIADTAILKYPACFPDSIIGFQSYKDKSDVRFIKYYFDIYKKHMESISMGATQNNLSVAKLESLTFKMPSIKVQKQIANVLSTYDKLIENNNRRIEILEESAEENYKEWFVRMRFPGYENTSFIKGIPEGWEVKRIEELAKFKRGSNLVIANAIQGEVPVIAGGMKPSCYHNQANTEAPVITVSASGANAGYTQLNHVDVWASDCSYLDTKETDLIYYLYLLLKVSHREILNLQVGSAQPHVYARDLNNFKFLKPTEELILKMNNIAKEIFNQIKNLTSVNQNLKKQRDLLLPRLMNGTIEVK